MNKILFHYLLSFVINILVICVLNIIRIKLEMEALPILAITKKMYYFFIESISNTSYHNIYIMRIIAYSCLALLITTHIAFIRKQNKFTITMFYFWNNIVFGFPNLYIFGFLFFIITNIR